MDNRLPIERDAAAFNGLNIAAARAKSRNMAADWGRSIIITNEKIFRASLFFETVISGKEGCAMNWLLLRTFRNGLP